MHFLYFLEKSDILLLCSTIKPLFTGVFFHKPLSYLVNRFLMCLFLKKVLHFPFWVCYFLPLNWLILQIYIITHHQFDSALFKVICLIRKFNFDCFHKLIRGSEVLFTVWLTPALLLRLMNFLVFEAPLIIFR